MEMRAAIVALVFLSIFARKRGPHVQKTTFLPHASAFCCLHSGADSRMD